MSFFGWINSLFTVRDAGGAKIVPQLDANGRFRVNTSESFSPSVGPTPPASPSDGDAWYNNAANQNMLYSYSAALGFWLSPEFPITWGEDSLDGNQAGWAGINNAGSGTGLLVPRDALITVLSANIRPGNATKQFFLQVGGATVATLDLVGGQLVTFPNLQVNANDLFWIAGNGAGGNILDVTFSAWWRWRVAP